MRRFVALAALTLGCAAATAPCERVHREAYGRTAMLNRTELIIVVDPGLAADVGAEVRALLTAMATGGTDGDGERDFIPTGAVDEARVRVMSAGVASGTPGCAEPRSTAFVHCGEPAIDVPIGTETVDPAALDAIECAIDVARASTCPIRAPIAAALGALRGGDLSSDPWLLILTEGDDCTLLEGASLEPSDDVHRQCVEAGLLSVGEAAVSLELLRIDIIGGIATPAGACTLAADPSLDPDPAGAPDCASGTAEATGPSRLADLACDLEERGVSTELRSICTPGWGEDLARRWTASNPSIVHLRAPFERDEHSRFEVYELRHDQPLDCSLPGRHPEPVAIPEGTACRLRQIASEQEGTTESGFYLVDDPTWTLPQLRLAVHPLGSRLVVEQIIPSACP